MINEHPDIHENRYRADAWCKKPIPAFPELRREVNSDKTLLWLSLERDLRYQHELYPVELNQATPGFQRQTRAGCFHFWGLMKYRRRFASDAHCVNSSNSHRNMRTGSQKAKDDSTQGLSRK